MQHNHDRCPSIMGLCLMLCIAGVVLLAALGRDMPAVLPQLGMALGMALAATWQAPGPPSPPAAPIEKE